VDRFSGPIDVMIPDDCPEKAACFDIRAIFKRLKFTCTPKDAPASGMPLYYERTEVL
jgi:hypothetical protein